MRGTTRYPLGHPCFPKTYVRLTTCFSHSLLGKPKDKTFAQSLFEDAFSVKVRKAVLETKFIKSMEENSLSPDQYRGFMLQDAAYVFHSIGAFNTAARNIQGTPPADFALFYRARSEGYSSYFSSKWKLQNANSVIMGPAAETYVAFTKNLAKNKPKYLAIGILPCKMLWPWVAQQIDSKVPKEGVYRKWVKDYLPKHPSSTPKFVNEHFRPREKANCQAIFNEGIINELNFFRSACGEELVSYSFGDDN